MSWGADAWGLHPWGADVPLAQPGVAPASPIPADRLDPRLGGPLVWVVELEAARDGGTLPVVGLAWGEDAWGALPPEPAPAGGAEVIRASDLGWRARHDAPGGAAAYPPLLLRGPDIERRVALAPGGADTWAVGTLTLATPDQLPGAALAGRDTALRAVRVRAGQQGWDARRCIATDPPAAALVDVLRGLALTWRAGEAGNEVPLRDPTAWLDQPIGSTRFAGTGGLQGSADMAGQPVPLVRGGSATAPVRACPARLCHAASQTYRWTDAGTPVAVLEDGAPVYTDAGQVPDVTAASPAAGTYVWDAQGGIRLGSAPAGQITVDGWSGPASAAQVLRNLLMVTAGLPPGLLDEGSVTATAAVAPWPGGWAWTGEETGREALAPLLAALGARLVPSRAGGLRLWPLRALGADARPLALLDDALALGVAPVELGELMPPAATIAVGWGRTHTTTTTPKPTVGAADRERLANAWRSASWSEPANLSRYAQASRPARLDTALLVGADATNLAGALGALWGRERRLWQVTLPVASVLAREIGDVVHLRWPAEGLRDGALGQVVGDGIRAGEPTGALLVLT